MLPWKFFEPERKAARLQIICPALDSWGKRHFSSLLRASRNAAKSEEALLCRGRPTDGPLGLGLPQYLVFPIPLVLCVPQSKRQFVFVNVKVVELESNVS